MIVSLVKFLTSDIDECDTGLVMISACPDISNCHNLIGSYSCGVPPDIEVRNPGIIKCTCHA